MGPELKCSGKPAAIAALIRTDIASMGPELKCSGKQQTRQITIITSDSFNGAGAEMLRKT
jgi:hypothetical protein